MNKNKWMMMAAVLTLSASVALAAPGEGGKFRGGKHSKRGEFGAKFAEKLNLTDAQKQQIRDLQQSFRDANEPLFTQARDTHRQLREARQAGDNERVTALQAQAKSQRAQLQQLRAQQKERILALLTPEQRAQWEALKAERESRRGGKRQRQ